MAETTDSWESRWLGLYMWLRQLTAGKSDGWGSTCNMSLRLYREQALQYTRQPLRTKYSRYGLSTGRYGSNTGRYGGSTVRYGRRSIGRSSKDSRKEFEGVSDEALSEQPISTMIDRYKGDSQASWEGQA